MNKLLANSLYFTLQKTRQGVSRAHIREATSLLESRTAWRDHVESRLRALHETGPDAFDWLEKQPLVDRASIVARQGTTVAPAGVRFQLRKTSGSTGVPFRFAKDLEMTAQMDAVMWAVYSWHGIHPGDRQARFWGSAQGCLPGLQQKLTDRLQNRRRLSAFSTTPESSKSYFEALWRFKPAFAYGYPTLMSMFAEYCSALGYDGRDLGIRTVICTGELLAPKTRDLLASFFGARVVDEYGCTESGVISISCEFGTSHLVPYALYPEIVNDDGKTSTAGSTGQVVISDLFGRFEPLLRYKLTDRAMLSLESSCPCGRELPVMGMQSGRLDSFILTPARGKVYDSILAYTVPVEVLKFAVRQVSIERLVAQVVPGRGFESQTTPAECRRRWEDALGPGVTVEVQTVSEIPLSPSGKLRYFTPLDEN